MNSGQAAKPTNSGASQDGGAEEEQPRAISTRTSGTFDSEEFTRLFREYVRARLSYAEVERRAGGLPAKRGALRRLLDAFDAGIGLTLFQPRHTPSHGGQK